MRLVRLIQIASVQGLPRVSTLVDILARETGKTVTTPTHIRADQIENSIQIKSQRIGIEKLKSTH